MKIQGTPTSPSRELQSLPTMLALAVLVHRLGGEVEISQADIDSVAYGQLLEGWRDGKLLLTVRNRPTQ